MTITKISYDRSRDYERVNQFLWRTYKEPLYPNWLQPRWEYMHWHPNLDASCLQRIALWEDDGSMAAMVNYEDRPGLAYLQRAPGYDALCGEMIEHAEKNLAAYCEGHRIARILANEFDQSLTAALKRHGYRQHATARECISMMQIPLHFPEIEIKEGFRLADLTEENDLSKLDRCLWRGYNHPGEPEPGGEASRALMQSPPNFNKKLNIIAVAPKGQYVSYSGIWYDPYNLCAYVEPVATDPDYRRMGLGKACVLECVRRAGEMGARVAYVESEQNFYHALGFRTIAFRPLWEKQVDDISRTEDLQAFKLFDPNSSINAPDSMAPSNHCRVPAPKQQKELPVY